MWVPLFLVVKFALTWIIWAWLIVCLWSSASCPLKIWTLFPHVISILGGGPPPCLPMWQMECDQKWPVFLLGFSTAPFSSLYKTEGTLVLIYHIPSHQVGTPALNYYVSKQPTSTVLNYYNFSRFFFFIRASVILINIVSLAECLCDPLL